MVDNGATVLINMFGSIVGCWVGVAGAMVTVSAAESIVGCGAGEPVGVQGIGWKGVGVSVAFGAEVTKTNGRVVWAGARVPHPTSNILARSITWKSLFIKDTVA